VAAWKYLNTKKNGNGNGKKPEIEVINRIDRWTIAHEAQTDSLLEATKEQVGLTREMRDAILLMADRRLTDR